MANGEKVGFTERWLFESIKQQSGYRVYVKADGEEVATSIGHRHRAKLIATAPELLDVLMELVYEIGYALPPDLKAKATSAISKAQL